MLLDGQRHGGGCGLGRFRFGERDQPPGTKLRVELVVSKQLGEDLALASLRAHDTGEGYPAGSRLFRHVSDPLAEVPRRLPEVRCSR